MEHKLRVFWLAVQKKLVQRIFLCQTDVFRFWDFIDLIE